MLCTGKQHFVDLINIISHINLWNKSTTLYRELTVAEHWYLDLIISPLSLLILQASAKSLMVLYLEVSLHTPVLGISWQVEEWQDTTWCENITCANISNVSKRLVWTTQHNLLALTKLQLQLKQELVSVFALYTHHPP